MLLSSLAIVVCVMPGGEAGKPGVGVNVSAPPASKVDVAVVLVVVGGGVDVEIDDVVDAVEVDVENPVLVLPVVVELLGGSQVRTPSCDAHARSGGQQLPPAHRSCEGSDGHGVRLSPQVFPSGQQPTAVQ